MEFGAECCSIDAESCILRRAAYVVIIDHGEIAAIKSKQHKRLWLPGGGLEFGETAEQALVREVSEELGGELKSFSRLGCATQYFYATAESCWYRMQAYFYQSNRLVLPADSSNGVTDWLWVSPELAADQFYHQCHQWAVRLACEK